MNQENFNQESVGKFQSLNFYIEDEALYFTGYEFNGEEIVIEESGCEQSLFRMDVVKKSGEIIVYAAYSEDYDVMEEVTDYFDTDKLHADILAYMVENKVDNSGKVYARYIKAINEGYDCQEAIYIAENEDNQ